MTMITDWPAGIKMDVKLVTTALSAMQSRVLVVGDVMLDRSVDGSVNAFRQKPLFLS